ncbi:MAG: SRPBCC family protein [Deltaproteobacteria bacterium]|nr:SRPBCC family protein [Deltaproteobacteria bacterium]
MAATTSKVTINAPIKTVYEVVTDFESYPEFLSGSKGVKILSKKTGSLQVEFKVDLIKTISYTLDFKLVAPKECSWTLVKGDFMKSNTGSWKLKEVKKGITEANYEIEIGFGLLVPGNIANILVGKNLPAMMKEFKDRAEAMSE